MRHGAAVKLAFMAALVLATLSACSNEDGGSDKPAKPLEFASGALAVSVANPGDMLAIPVSGGSGGAFHIRFSFGADQVDSPVFHLGGGNAYVMVPPMASVTQAGVSLSIVSLAGKQLDVHPQLLTITAANGTGAYTRASFDAAVGGGLARFVNLAVEAIDTLEAEAVADSATAAGIRTALNQQADILNQIGYFTDNLNDEQLALLQQLMENTGLLQFLADAAGVSLVATGSQSAALSSVVHALIESALLKADFASLLIGEVRGALALIAYVMNQISGWPFIGGWAQGVANWATGLSATLQGPQDIINTMIPSDMVLITASSLPRFAVGQSVDVNARGRIETESAFNQQLLAQLIQTHVVSRLSSLIAQLGATLPAQGQAYLQQLAQQVPGWVIGWLTSAGYIQTTVVPGQSYTVLVLDNFSLDMSQYRFNVAGIVANLLNLPYSAVNSFMNWIGLGVGTPVGGYEGVHISNTSVAGYTPTADQINGLGAGTTTATYIAPVCRPAGGWWAQWGFYGIARTTRNVSVTVQ